MPGKNQTYGVHYKTITFVVGPEEHHAVKIKAASYGISVADVCRLAIQDEVLWKRAQKLKSRKKEDSAA